MPSELINICDIETGKVKSTANLKRKEPLSACTFLSKLKYPALKVPGTAYFTSLLAGMKSRYLFPALLVGIFMLRNRIMPNETGYRK